jgi:hypothetical protein
MILIILTKNLFVTQALLQRRVLEIKRECQLTKYPEFENPKIGLRVTDFHTYRVTTFVTFFLLFESDADRVHPNFVFRRNSIYVHKLENSLKRVSEIENIVRF